MNIKSLLVVGTGALATLFAARLSAAGVNITMLGSWLEALEALQTKGARIVEADGTEYVYPVRTIRTAAEVKKTRFALVLVKSWQTEYVAEQLSSCLSKDGLALTLQNGFGNKEILERALGVSRVALGITTLGATLLEPGLVRPGGEGTITLEAQARATPLEAMFRQAGFSVEWVKDSTSLLWGKLVINAAINPLTALLRVSNGELLQRPTSRLLMGELASEAAAVARSLGVRLPFQNPTRAAEEVAQRTAGNYSSMLQDVLRGASTEIDAICGAIVRLGEKKSIPTPANRMMWQLVKALSAYGSLQ